MARANSVITITPNEAAGTLTLTGVGITDTVTLDVRKLTGEELYDLLPPVARTGLLHGFKQKGGDAAAIERDEKTGKSATAQEKFDAVKRVFTHLAGGGAWSARVAGGYKLNTVETDKLLEELRSRGITV